MIISLGKGLMLIALFFVLYKFVIPRLFPEVVQGVYVIDPEKTALRAKKRSNGVKNEAGDDAAFSEPIVLSGGGIGLVSGHSSHGHAQLRRRNAESKGAFV